MMKETLKEIAILQQRRLKLPQPVIPRNQYQEIVDYIKLPHSVVVMGVRRCGKSTLLTQVLNEHFPDQFYYLNFEDERLLNFTVADFTMLYEIFVELFGERKIFYFDEIQNIDSWEVYVRRMQDEGFKFFITGSNAAMLSKEMGTKLTGRHVDVELYPFSFKEFLAFNNFKVSDLDLYDPKIRGILSRYFNDYLETGGMPEYLKYQDQAILQSVYEDILFRDIITRYEIQDIKALRELGLYLMSNPASLFSYNKLKNSLQLGSVNTVKNYVDYLENSYLISCINQFSYSLHQQNISNKKSYVIDNGLANAISFQFSKNKGQFLENLVYLELKHRKQDIYYYKTAKNLEIDFLLRTGKDITQLLQVSHDLSDPKTKSREINALLQAMDETGLEKVLLLTSDQSEQMQIENKKIVIMPVYQWLLGK